MINKNQTAVEWLFAHLLPFLSFSDVKEREYFRKCLEESKAMEKEQIKDAYANGSNDRLKNTIKDYYNENYGN